MFGRKDSLIFICVLPKTGPYFQCHMWWSFLGAQGFEVIVRFVDIIITVDLLIPL
jgi:hypothetical protein